MTSDNLVGFEFLRFWVFDWTCRPVRPQSKLTNLFHPVGNLLLRDVTIQRKANSKKMNTTVKNDFLRWYEPLHTRFIRYCSSRAFGIIEAEDLAQEAILATLAGWERIRDKEKLLSYMMGVVNNRVRNQLRRKKFQGPLDEKQLEALESRLGDPEAALDVQYLLRSLRELPATQQEALLLFEVSGFSIREIAGIQEASEGAVKTRISRARKHLRELVEEDGRRLSAAQRLSTFASILL